MKIICLFGIVDSGKTTIAREIAKRVSGSVFIDAHPFRELLGNTNYTYEGRRENLCNIAKFCEGLEGEALVILAFNAPTADLRGVFSADVQFIHCDCSVEEAKRRDTKGLYAAGDKVMLPAVSEDFDADGAAFTVDSENDSASLCADQILEFLK